MKPWLIGLLVGAASGALLLWLLFCRAQPVPVDPRIAVLIAQHTADSIRFHRDSVVAADSLLKLAAIRAENARLRRANADTLARLNHTTDSLLAALPDTATTVPRADFDLVAQYATTLKARIHLDSLDLAAADAITGVWKQKYASLSIVAEGNHSLAVALQETNDKLRKELGKAGKCCRLGAAGGWAAVATSGGVKQGPGLVVGLACRVL